ncbi:MAG: RNA 2',3'-cyclic phosphodiesterase [Synergistaceae bacterium]|nr:RNA 2',3'-cyclic phosphodiesterase [Synergistaceae bacterium]
MNKDVGVIRTFVCTIPDAASVSEIGEFIERIRGFREYKCVSLEQIHITLKFLGNTSLEQAQRLDTNLSRLGALRPFWVKIYHAGAFPNMSRPKSLWLGIRDGGDSLEKLASLVDKAAQKSGFAPERRRFKAHITVARARTEGELSEEMSNVLTCAPTPSWLVESFILMKSVLTPQGPVYTPLGEYPLK